MADLVTIGFRANTGDLTKAQREMDRLTKSGAGADKQLGMLEKTVGRLGGVFAGIGSAAIARELAKQADEWKSINNQLRQVTDSEKELLAVRGRLVDVSKDTRSELSATVKLYSAIDRATSSLGVSTDEQIKITKTINNLFMSGGASAQEMAGAIRQLAQGLEAGALRGDEFNSVAENAPRIMDALAKKLQMTRGELREFAATGGITAQIMVDALSGYSKEAQRLADQTERTFGQSLTVATTNITEFAGSSKVLSQSMDFLGDSIVSISENMNALTNAALAAGGVYAVSLTPALANYLKTQTASAVMTLTATNRVTGLSAALGVQASAATTATVASNALGAAWRFMLGPVGLVVTALGAAAVAFSLTKDAAIDLDNALGDTAKTVDDIARRYQNFTASMLGREAVSVQQQILEIEMRRADTLKRLLDLGLSEADAKKSAMYNRDAKALLELQKRHEAINKIFMDGLPAINKTVEVQQELGVASSFNANAFSKLAIAASLQNSELKMGADAFELMRTEMELIATGAAPEQVKAILNVVKANQELRKSVTLEGEADSIIDEINNIGGAWTATGNAMVDAFGSASDAINQYSSRMTQLIELQDKLNETRKQYEKDGKSTLKLDQAQARINSENLSAQLEGIGSVLGASKSLFDEQSKGRKAIHALEMGFMAAEIVLATEKAIVSAVAAIANQGSGDPYSAFGRIAAMSGIMAGVLAAGGIAFGGGGGSGDSSVKTIGTGQVLGDQSAQTQAISNSFEDMQDIEIDQLLELKGLRDDIRSAFSGIAGLSGLLAGRDFSVSSNLGVNTGRFSSTFKAGDLFGKSGLLGIGDIPTLAIGNALGYSDDAMEALFGVKKTLKDSGIKFFSQSLSDAMASGEIEAVLFETIRTKKKTLGITTSDKSKTYFDELDDEISSQLSKVFISIGSSVEQAAAVLGIDVEDTLQNFMVNLGSISLKGKSGDEITKTLTAAFSEQADTLSRSLIPELYKWQEVGESSFDTLVRLANQQAYFNDITKMIGLSLGDVSTVMRIDVAQAIADLSGGFENFAEISSEYYEKFFTDQEKFINLQSSLGDAFGDLGLSLVYSRDSFRQLVESVDITTEAGQAMLTSLLELSPAMDDYIGQLEEAQKERISGLKSERDSLSSLTDSIGRMIGDAVTVEQALAAARMGDFSLANQIGSLQPLTAASSAELRYAEALRESRLAEIASLAEDQASELDMQIMQLESQTSLLESQLSVLESIDSTLKPVDVQPASVSAPVTSTAPSTTDDQKAIIAGIAQNLALVTKYIRDMSQDATPVRIVE